jgi:hypothetical protein
MWRFQQTSTSGHQWQHLTLGVCLQAGSLRFASTRVAGHPVQLHQPSSPAALALAVSRHSRLRDRSTVGDQHRHLHRSSSNVHRPGCQAAEVLRRAGAGLDDFLPPVRVGRYMGGLDCCKRQLALTANGRSAVDTCVQRSKLR